MMRKGILFIVMLLVTTTMFAQGFKLGAVGGANTYKVCGDVESRSRLGWFGGVVAEFESPSGFITDFTFLYDCRNSDWVNEFGYKDHESAKYISVAPFALGYKAPTGDTRPFLKVSPIFSALLNARCTQNYGNAKESYSITDWYRDNIFGLGFTCGLEFHDLRLSVTYDLGLTDMDKYDGKNYFRGLMFSAVLLF